MTRFVIAFALGLGATPLAHAQSSEALELAKRLVVASGLSVQLQSFPQQVAQDLAQMRGKVAEAQLNALGSAAKESYHPPTLQADIEQTLARRLPVAQMKKAIAWLETDAGRRVTRAEELAGETLTPQAMQAYAEETRRRPPSARRLELVEGLVSATTAVDSTVKLIESIALGIALGMDAMQPAQKRLGLAALQERLRSAMPPQRLRQSIAAAMPGMYGYMYREVSDADLEAYLAFNRSAEGKRYNEALIAAFTAALGRASVRVGALMDAAMRKKSA